MRTKGAIHRILHILFYLLIAVLLLFSAAGASMADWLEEVFQTTFREIIYTYRLGLRGADTSFLRPSLTACLNGILFAAVLLLAVILADILLTGYFSRRNEEKGQPGCSRFRRRYRAAVLVCCLLLAANTFLYADQVLKISPFLKSRFINTSLYEREYVDPASVSITLKGEPRNLILIYLESMEITYADHKSGGAHQINIIPGLTALALEEDTISFGEPGVVSGIHALTGTTFTTGAILASTSGVPFAFRQGRNMMVLEDAFAPGLTTLGDILEGYGYRQVFMCGSDAEFGGREMLMEEHGDFEIFDYYTAIVKGYIASDYNVWWGLEDHILYEMAKDELLELAAGGQPFNFTMLTVDTHHVGGYVCPWCGDEFHDETANVIACADRQICAFIAWCREQDFYENTTIVILGDHPRMDKALVSGVPYYNRATYNCLINADTHGRTVEQKRIATIVDMFPTILAALGFEIEGDRLGLGVDLCSDTPTLAEEKGYDWLNAEAGKNSKYYQENFTKER